MVASSRAFDSFDPTNTQSATRRLFLETLYRDYGPGLVDYAAGLLRDEDAAEDVVQEAFTSILAGRFPVPAVDVCRKLEIIVHAHCVDHLETQARARLAKARLRARDRPRERIWRSWRVTPLRPRDHAERDKDEGDAP